ncbi:MAG TPA: dihydrofolate reductase family protein [Verrucomicrobiae bacterium]|nr:dihydrofolate reductase family protein [Verrucomicrobiae bacterium]
MTIATRMALQMLVALALAFTVGMLAFPLHWSWVVLTAFIVCSGAVGRGEAIYKGLLRVAGAIGGTVVAAAISPVVPSNGAVDATIIFVVLFFGMWLRTINYAYWAACATLIFALLQGSQGASIGPLFAIRVACIVVGALCAIAATWFVFPMRTRLLVRKRVAEARAALREVRSGSDRDLRHHLAQLERVAPPVRLHRAVFGARGETAHPAALIDETQARLRTAIERRKVRVYVSVAVSLDGYIDDRSDQRLVLSSPEDLADMRLAREQCDALLVGAETVRRDNPSLRSPNAARVTVTESGELDPALRFFDGSARTIVLTGHEGAEKLRTRLGDRAEIVAIEQFEPAAIIAALADCGLHSLFVEGGGRILTAFLAAGAFDRLRLAIAPFFVGDAAAPRLVNAASFLNDAKHRLTLRGVRALGDIAVLEYEHPRT